jgi:hypothetical protein
MSTPRKKKRLLDAYRFGGFAPLEEIAGVFGDPSARVIKLVRRRKKPRAGHVGACIGAGMINAFAECATFPAAPIGSFFSSRFAASNAGLARR